MRTNLSKKLLAALLSLAMVFSLVGIQPASANAAAKYSITKNTSTTAGKSTTLKVKGVKKTQYIKVSFNSEKVSIKNGSKALKNASTKVNGTGKALSLKVTTKELNADYGFKVTVKVYNKKTKKIVKTLVSNNNKVKTTYVEPTPEEPTPEEPSEPVVEEAKLVSLEATHVKELVATLSKEVAGLTAADFTVKKGNVKVTPANVTVEGTKVVITLGTKIVEGTYSVEYKDGVVSVDTKDETLTSLATVGSNFALFTDYENLDTISSPAGSFQAKKDSSNVAAQIQYEALNQYGDAMACEMNTISSSFGGNATWTEPTTKKPGVITIYNISSALGIVGSTGKIIMVSKTGVSATSEVTFAEECKIAKVELKGIYNVKTGKFVETIPAQVNKKLISNYKLVINIFDQYANNINALADKKLEGQTISQAQVLTNVKVADAATGKIGDESYDFIDVESEEDQLVLNLDCNEGDGKTKSIAGTLKLIIVGDRFGSVFNEELTVEQIDLLEKFTMSADNGVYNQDKNEITFTATSKAGKEITDFDTLDELVKFSAAGMKFEKQTDGSAKLYWTPSSTINESNESLKDTTVESITVTLNKDISPADQIVTTQTFTVKETKRAVAVVKYTGDTLSTSSTLFLKKSKFVFEDQYGNAMKSTDFNYGNIKVEYRFSDGSEGTFSDKQTTTFADTYKTSVNLFKVTVDNAKDKYYFRLDDSDLGATYSNSIKHPLTKDNADCSLSVSRVDDQNVTSVTATWAGTTQVRVTPNKPASGVKINDFEFEGSVNGKTVALDADAISATIIDDTYEPIKTADKDSAVKTATVKINVVLKDAANKEYTETITCDYTYSAMDPYIYAISSAYDLLGATLPMTMGEVKNAQITYGELADLFEVTDQYDKEIPSTLSLEVQLGNNTSKRLEVVNNKSKAAYIKDGEAPFTAGDIAKADQPAFTVIATEPSTGKTSVQKLYVTHKNSQAETDAAVAEAAREAKTVESIAAFDALTISNAKYKSITLKTEEAGILTIAAGTYDDVDLVIDAPNATVVNHAEWKSVTIKAVAADTYVEYADNDITVAGAGHVEIAAGATASVEVTTDEAVKVTAEATATLELVIATPVVELKLEGAGTVTVAADKNITLDKNSKIVNDLLDCTLNDSVKNEFDEAVKNTIVEENTKTKETAKNNLVVAIEKYVAAVNALNGDKKVYDAATSAKATVTEAYNTYEALATTAELNAVIGHVSDGVNNISKADAKYTAASTTIAKVEFLPELSGVYYLKDVNGDNKDNATTVNNLLHGDPVQTVYEEAAVTYLNGVEGTLTVTWETLAAITEAGTYKVEGTLNIGTGTLSDTVTGINKNGKFVYTATFKAKQTEDDVTAELKAKAEALFNEVVGTIDDAEALKEDADTNKYSSIEAALADEYDLGGYEEFTATVKVTNFIAATEKTNGTVTYTVKIVDAATGNIKYYEGTQTLTILRDMTAEHEAAVEKLLSAYEKAIDDFKYYVEQINGDGKRYSHATEAYNTLKTIEKQYDALTAKDVDPVDPTDGDAELTAAIEKYESASETVVELTTNVAADGFKIEIVEDAHNEAPEVTVKYLDGHADIIIIDNNDENAVHSTIVGQDPGTEDALAEEDVTLEDGVVTLNDTEKEGWVTISLTFGGKSTSFKVTFVAPELEP